MLKALDISTSGLVAQRVRMDTIAGNVANISSLQNEKGEAQPYQERFVLFQPDESTQTANGAIGVKVSSIQTETVKPRMVYNPNHPLSDKNGYVAYPRINMMEQMVDSLIATRAYEANLGVMEVTKNMGEQTLRIIS